MKQLFKSTCLILLLPTFCLAAKESLLGLCEKADTSSYVTKQNHVDLDSAELANVVSYASVFSGDIFTADNDDGLSGSLTINLSPSKFASIYAENKTLDVAHSTYHDNKAKQLMNIANDYLDVVKLLKLRKSLAFEEKISTSNFDKSQNEFKAGIVSRSEMLSWENRYNLAKSKLIDNDVKIYDKIQSIYRQTGIIPKEIKTFSNKKPVNISLSSDSKLKMGVLLAPVTKKNTPSYLDAMKKKWDAAKINSYSSSLSSAFPEINFTLSSNKTDMSYTLSINATNISSALATYQSEKTARLNYLKKQRENHAKTVFLAKKLAQQKNKITVAVSSYKNSIEAYKAANADYKAGKTTQLSLFNAINGVTSQRTNLINAQADLLKEYISLSYEMGHLNVNSIELINNLLISSEEIP
tara:strand:+ start:1593 stop:2828 length:1236 start_codon:yes stop_codon:yes gene_type:complete